MVESGEETAWKRRRVSLADAVQGEWSELVELSHLAGGASMRDS